MNKARRTVVVALAGLILPALFYFSFVAIAYAQEPQQEAKIEVDGEFLSREELRQRVDELMKKSNVERRRGVNAIFALGRVYEEEGDIQDAAVLYEKALQVNAWNLEYQLRLARLLAGFGRKVEAVDKARLAYEYAEEEDLIKEAESFLVSMEEPIDTQKSHIQPDENVQIVLVSMGTASERMLREMEYGLEEMMGIDFVVSERRKDIGGFDRTAQEKFVDYSYEAIMESLPAEGKKTLLLELSLDEKDLESLNNKLKVIYAFFDKFADKGRQWRENFDKQLEQARSSGQYSTSRLINELKREFTLEKGSRIKGYLAVCAEDIYMDDTNFVFGSARPGYGAMSYIRFTGGFNSEDQNRPRLIKRAIKQGLSSSFFILGIPRCTTPICVRAYPHNLSEHDQKGNELCAWCRERLNLCTKER